MKLIHRVNCITCKIKCNFYTALIESGYDAESFETIHIKYKRHEMICKQGTKVTHAIYLVYGTAKLYVEGYNNRNIILYILKPHNYIGLLSFFESTEYVYSVRALEETSICMVDLEHVKKLYLTNHKFLLNLNHAFGQSVKLIMSKIISINQKQIRGRVAESLIYLSQLYKNKKFVMNLTRKELGEFSSISEENTVRILTEMKNENIICINGKEIEIIDLKLLEKISEFG